jgi:hypothetical protein
MTRQSRSNIGAYLLIGLGILFLVGQTGILDLGGIFDTVFDLSWPMFIIIPGVVFLLIAWFGNKTEGFAVPGTIITGTGVIMTVQNATNHWESWAYVWTLYPGLVGLAIMFMGWRTNNTKQFDDGRKMVFGSVVACAIFFAIFEGLIFNNVFSWNLLPVVLIGLGLVLLFRSRLPAPAKAKNEPMLMTDKPKNPPAPTNGKPRSAADIDPELRRKIDEALNEDVPPAPKL